MTAAVTNKMKKDKQRLSRLREVGERRSGGALEGDTKCRRKYVAGALECETDEQIA